MKSFVFSLEKMRNYKDQVLNREKGILSDLKRRRDEMADRKAKLEQDRIHSHEDFRQRQQKGVTALELSQHNYLSENMRRQLEQLALDLINAEADVERQTRVVLSVSQEVSALDKLEEKQLDEHRYQESKSEELRIDELLTTGHIKSMTAELA